MRAALILAPYALGLVAFFQGLTPVWPWLLASCAIAARWNPRAAIVLAVGVIVLQAIKAYAPEHPWVFYGATYAILGFVSAAFIDKVIAAAVFVIGAVYIFLPADLTEIAFYCGLIGAVYVGPSGGIFTGVLFAPKRFNAGGVPVRYRESDRGDFS